MGFVPWLPFVTDERISGPITVRYPRIDMMVFLWGPLQITGAVMRIEVGSVAIINQHKLFSLCVSSPSVSTKVYSFISILMVISCRLSSIRTYDLGILRTCTIIGALPSYLRCRINKLPLHVLPCMSAP